MGLFEGRCDPLETSGSLCAIMPQVQASVCDSCSVSVSMSDRISHHQTQGVDKHRG
ncbi:hypothetical protein QO004_004834 [Rhizobium mesoamericanum]|nr:hypothetical protein [Rhizobium mesoamericanum]